MRRFGYIILTGIMTINICALTSMTSFAAKTTTKKQATEQVAALVISNTEAAGFDEYDEPEIEDAVDAAENHGNPIDNEKKKEEINLKAAEEIEQGQGVSKKSDKSAPGSFLAEARTTSANRQKLAEYALKFVGGKYKYGGNTPAGFDCSGFVQYVYKYAGGMNLLRNSAAQATQGRTVTEETMQVGDLLFYSNGSRINHVAIYIGDGKVVHSSNERSGIKISPWDYRTPVAIKNVLD